MARRRYGYYGSGGTRYGYSRGGYQRRVRRNEERHIELVSLGLILALFFLAFLFPQAFSTPLLLLGGGLILLGGAFFQSQRRFRVNPMTWLGGAIGLAAGIIELQTHTEPFGLLLPVLIFGGVIAGSVLTGEF